MDERSPAFTVRAPSATRPPVTFAMIKVAAGDVHLVQNGVHALREHARTVGVQVEAAFLADDGLVDTALVALALVVGLKNPKEKRSQFSTFKPIGTGQSQQDPNNELGLEFSGPECTGPSHLRGTATPTLSSRPSARMTTMRPRRLRPVRPILCTRRMGFFCASKQTMRSTSPMSRPSSPTQVDTSVLKPPCRNLCTTCQTSSLRSSC